MERMGAVLEKLNQLLKGPQILLEKPLISMVIGAAFVVSGVLSLLFMQDLVFFAMSLLIAAYCVYIGLRLLRQLLDGEYTVLEGRCTERRKSMFSGYLHIVIEDGELGTVSVRLKRKTAEQVLVDRSYRLYFMGVLEVPRDLSETRFWALEEV